MHAALDLSAPSPTSRSPALYRRQKPRSLESERIPDGRPDVLFRHGPYEISRRHHRGEGLSSVRVVHVSAALGGKQIGYLEGFVVDLRRYGDADVLLMAMDRFSQTTYDAAAFIADKGPRYWRTRGVLCFLDTAEVEPSHRGRGLARAMAETTAFLARTRGPDVDVLIQPFPLEIIAVEEGESTSGADLVSEEARDQELKAVTRCWRRVFPFLRRAARRGGINDDRDYYWGRVPREWFSRQS